MKNNNWPLWKNVKMSKVRHHICAGKVGDVGQEISGKMNFLSRLAPPYLTDKVGQDLTLRKCGYGSHYYTKSIYLKPAFAQKPTFLSQVVSI